MADRIDALGEAGVDRYASLQGRVLSETHDPELEGIVREAAALMHAPIALVSLVLGRTQFFRAQYGLPGDLAVTRGTDRDVSFCQFVVRDNALFEVEDAATDARVPQELVTRYGIRSYMGAPVRVDDQVIGSLCTIGVEPRQFVDSERDALGELAARASRRLTSLARERAGGPALAARAARPALGELRNRLTPLVLGLDRARVALLELGILRRLGTLDPAS